MIIADKLWVQDRIEGGLAGRYNYKRLGDRDGLGRVCVGRDACALVAVGRDHVPTLGLQTNETLVARAYKVIESWTAMLLRDRK
jgi:hypothetical protein